MVFIVVCIGRFDSLSAVIAVQSGVFPVGVHGHALPLLIGGAVRPRRIDDQADFALHASATEHTAIGYQHVDGAAARPGLASDG